MKKYGVTVIGCGHIGCRHLDNISKRNDIKLFCVCDTGENIARETAEKYGAEHFTTDYKEFLTSDKVDIVVIATYASSHTEILENCLKHGKHVLCEKPLGTDEIDGRKFVSLVKNTDKKVLVSLCLRHDPVYIKMKQLIDKGAIGDVRSVRIVQNQQVPENERTYNLLKDCSPILDGGIHYIDIVKWFTGSEMYNLECKGTKEDEAYPRENYSILTFTLKNGGIGYIETGWDRSISSERKIEFVGNKGRIEVVTANINGHKSSLGSMLRMYNSETNEYSDILPDNDENAFSLQFTELIEMIEKNKVGSPDIDEVYSAYETALKAQKMMKK